MEGGLGLPRQFPGQCCHPVSQHLASGGHLDLLAGEEANGGSSYRIGEEGHLLRRAGVVCSQEARGGGGHLTGKSIPKSTHTLLGLGSGAHLVGRASVISTYAGGVGAGV